ncbi:MAG: DUF368 domain-containing protein [Bacteroidota bacterium]|nr:DUF368 domain-containing protein [Bacteroidota bacterium]
MRKIFLLFLKGMGMGIANVIPGVSGGTIALITNIYEELIESLKSCNLKALKMLISLNFKEFARYTNLNFLIIVFGGSIISVFGIAWVFDFLFTNYPKYIWGFFFGLILSSIYYIGKRVLMWNYVTKLSLIIGALLAISISFLSFSQENSNLFYVFLCGIIGVSGMLLPGLSGSYILLIMGNYKLLLVTAIKNIDYILLSVFFAGSVFGLMSFSHILSFLLKKYKDIVLAVLSGFILGSLVMIWPWSNRTEVIVKPIIQYAYLPNIYDISTIITIGCILTGVITVIILENSSRQIIK